jgi:hypothetical protein
MAWFSMARRVSAAAFLSPLLAACASSAVTQEDAARIHTVGIVSGCAEKLSLVHLGTLIFTNSYDAASIRDWNLDKRIVEGITRELAGRYDIRSVEYDPADFSFDPKKDSPSDFDPAIMRNHIKSGQPYDAYIAVVPSTRMDVIQHRDAYLTGTGVYDGNVLGTVATDIYTSCSLVFIDGRTFKIIARSPLRTTTESFFTANRPWNAPIRPSDFAPSYAMLTPEQKENLRNELGQLIDTEMPNTLKLLKLIP